jgi:hypothetical protein
LSFITAFTLWALPVQAGTQEVFLLGFAGFDYESPDGNPGTYLAIGEGYKAVGFVTSVGPMLTPYYDTDVNEYTFYLFNLTVSARFFDIPTQILSIEFANNGRGRYFEDDLVAGTNAGYGINPPNATAPSTFIDGTLVLGGDVDQFRLYYDFNQDQGGYSGEMTQDEGTYFTLNYVNPLDGWTLGGLLGRPNPSIPQGYDNQLSGECKIVIVPTTQSSWGAIKRTYR